MEGGRRRDRRFGGLVELIGSLENTLVGLWEEALGGVDGETGILGVLWSSLAP